MTHLFSASAPGNAVPHVPLTALDRMALNRLHLEARPGISDRVTLNSRINGPHNDDDALAHLVFSHPSVLRQV